ncbi:MAG: hypothetical protein J6K28_08380 [Alistipes sp.]|nr:hypothetical protein [Alistipes sp.]
MAANRDSMLDIQRVSMSDKMFGVLSAGYGTNDVEIVATIVRNLLSSGCFEQNIKIRKVPSVDDIPLGVQFFAEYTDVDAVIVLSYDDTLPDYIKSAVIQLQIQWNMPVVFGSELNTYWKAHGTAMDMVSLQVMMEAESAESVKSNPRSIN